MSAFGEWTTAEGVPAFRYTLDQDADDLGRWDPLLDPPSRRHVVHLGNRRITLVADDSGRADLYDEHTAMRWLTRRAGVARLRDERGAMVSTAHDAGTVRERLFGPAFARVVAADRATELERTVLCPPGERPWVLIRLVVRDLLGERRRVTLTEDWRLCPAEARLLEGPVPVAGPSMRLKVLGGVPHEQGLIVLDLEPGGERAVFLRAGLGADEVADPAGLFEASLAALREELPRAAAGPAPEAAREIPWHAALLTGGACRDGVLGGHTLNQGSAYAFRHGFNGAARDPLQHALPLVYLDPPLALSVLRNTCAWGGPDGDLPYALGPDKTPTNLIFRPSDQQLWALWLAAEYAAVTGDLDAFRQSAPYHPIHQAPPAALGEHLRRQFRFLADVVGLGEHGHLRILSADWNDLAIADCPLPREVMIARGESVLNSALAAWVLPRYAALAARLGDPATAQEAGALAGRLREAVAAAWTGRWFARAYGPGAVVGETDLWLEAQPWAILCGAASADQAARLLATIEETCAAGSPLGPRIRWPAPAGSGRAQIWYAVNAPLVWAAARHRPDLAWDWWRRMTLTAHTRAYPRVWEGTLSGPDAYLAPEQVRPGGTWDLPDLGVAMQAYPVANLHAHAQPILAYLRLLGVEPAPDGSLCVGGGASFASRVLTIGADGSGGLAGIRGPVRVRTGTGRILDATEASLTWSG